MIALITPTGARAKQIQLCAKWMSKQTYTGKVLWVVVDDCKPTTTDFIKENFHSRWKIVKVYPKPSWEKGQNTQARNLLAGIEVVKRYEPEYTFIIEDDDYYKPCYLEEMMKRCVPPYDLIGECYTVYYNVLTRTWKRHQNREHASLFQAAFSQEGLKALEKTCENAPRFIDIEVFREYPEKNKIKLFSGIDLAIGIKGLPGRPGIGIGHTQMLSLKKEDRMVTLKEWIGNDYMFYL